MTEDDSWHQPQASICMCTHVHPCAHTCIIYSRKWNHTNYFVPQWKSTERRERKVFIGRQIQKWIDYCRWKWFHLIPSFSEERARIYSSDSDEGSEEDKAQRLLKAKKLNSDEVSHVYWILGFPCSPGSVPGMTRSPETLQMSSPQRS